MTEPGGAFPETRWSAIRAAGDPDHPDSRRRFEDLARAYWPPIYAFFRWSRGYARDEAQDLTQEFFVHLIESPILERADPSRARFRTYLKTCLANFAAKEFEARGRRKRGGGAKRFSLDFGDADREVQVPDPRSPDPVAIVDVEWRRLLLERAFERLGAALAARGEPRSAEVFRAYYLAPPGEERPTYAVLAERFGIPPSTLVNVLYRARKLYKQAILDQIADGAASDEEARLEYRELFGEDP